MARSALSFLATSILFSHLLGTFFWNKSCLLYCSYFTNQISTPPWREHLVLSIRIFFFHQSLTRTSHLLISNILFLPPPSENISIYHLQYFFLNTDLTRISHFVSGIFLFPIPFQEHLLLPLLKWKFYTLTSWAELAWVLTDK